MLLVASGCVVEEKGFLGSVRLYLLYSDILIYLHSGGVGNGRLGQAWH